MSFYFSILLTLLESGCSYEQQETSSPSLPGARMYVAAASQQQTAFAPAIDPKSFISARTLIIKGGVK
jgi:hypothetical protein